MAAAASMLVQQAAQVQDLLPSSCTTDLAPPLQLLVRETAGRVSTAADFAKVGPSRLGELHALGQQAFAGGDDTLMPPEMAARRFVVETLEALEQPTNELLQGRSYPAFATGVTTNVLRGAYSLAAHQILALVLRVERVVLAPPTGDTLVERAATYGAPDRSFLPAAHRLQPPVAPADFASASLEEVVQRADFVLCGVRSLQARLTPAQRKSLTAYGAAAFRPAGSRRGRGALDPLRARQLFVAAAGLALLEDVPMSPPKPGRWLPWRSKKSPAATPPRALSLSKRPAPPQPADRAPIVASVDTSAVVLAVALSAAAVQEPDSPLRPPSPPDSPERRPTAPKAGPKKKKRRDTQAAAAATEGIIRELYMLDAEMAPEPRREAVEEANRALAQCGPKLAALSAARRAELWALRQQVMVGRCEVEAPSEAVARESFEYLRWAHWQRLGGMQRDPSTQRWLEAANAVIAAAEVKRGSVGNWGATINLALMSDAVREQAADGVSRATAEAAKEDAALLKIQRAWQQQTHNRLWARKERAATTIQRWWQGVLALVVHNVWEYLERGVAVLFHPQDPAAPEVEAVLWGDRTRAAIFVARSKDSPAAKVVTLALANLAPPRSRGQGFWFRQRSALLAGDLERTRCCITLVATTCSVDVELRAASAASKLYHSLALLRDRYSERVVGHELSIDASSALTRQMAEGGVHLEHHSELMCAGVLWMSTTAAGDQLRLNVSPQRDNPTGLGVDVEDIVLVMHGLGELTGDVASTEVNVDCCLSVLATERVLRLEFESAERRDFVWTGLRALVDLHVRPDSLVAHPEAVAHVESHLRVRALRAEVFAASRLDQLNPHQIAHLGAYARQAIYHRYMPNTIRGGVQQQLIGRRWQRIEAMDTAECLDRFTFLVCGIFEDWEAYAPAVTSSVHVAEVQAGDRIVRAARAHLERERDVYLERVRYRRRRRVAARVLQKWWKRVFEAERAAKFDAMLEVNRARIRSALRSLTRGFRATKIRRDGKPSRVNLWLGKNRERVYIGKRRHMNEGIDHKGVFVADISELREGADSHGFFEHHQRLLANNTFKSQADAENRMLSLVSGERTFDLIFDDLEARTEFVGDLSVLLYMARIFVERNSVAPQREVWRNNARHEKSSHNELAMHAKEFLDAGTRTRCWDDARMGFLPQFLWVADAEWLCVAPAKAQPNAPRSDYTYCVSVGDVVAVHMEYVPPNVEERINQAARQKRAQFEAQKQRGGGGGGFFRRANSRPRNNNNNGGGFMRRRMSLGSVKTRRSARMSFSMADLNENDELDLEKTLTIVSSAGSIVLQCATHEERDHLFILLHAFMQQHRGGHAETEGHGLAHVHGMSGTVREAVVHEVHYHDDGTARLASDARGEDDEAAAAGAGEAGADGGGDGGGKKGKKLKKKLKKKNKKKQPVGKEHVTGHRLALEASYGPRRSSITGEMAMAGSGAAPSRARSQSVYQGS